MSYCSEKLRTLPISTPRKSIGAPTVRPRSVPSNTSRTGTGSPRGGASAVRRSLNSAKAVLAGAGVARGLSGACSKATPPASTEAAVWVLRVKPFASINRSMPLAFQKRDCAVTSCW